MKIWCVLGVTSLTIFLATNTIAAPLYKSAYVGQENRRIKSLSEDDMEQLASGKGWGLAKAAELNGMPGPSHLLQMKEEISLTKEQELKIRTLFDDMKSKAIPLGNRLISLEKKLNDSFAQGAITEKELDQQLESIAETRKKLRYVHLVTHLKTPRILTSQQIKQYNLLRGYNSGDPCKNIPKGHDREMWMKHNGCK